MAFSDVIDDLAARVEQVQGYLPKDFNEYLKLRATEEFIKVTGGAKGNQTAADIAKGVYGAPPAVAGGGGNPASMNSISAGQIMSSMGGLTIPILIASAVGLYFLMRK